MKPQTDAFIGEDGLLASRCWCDTRKVRVTPADVRNGLTVSCGVDDCSPDWEPPPPPPKPRTLWAVLDAPVGAKLRQTKSDAGWRKLGAPGDTVRARNETAPRRSERPGPMVSTCMEGTNVNHDSRTRDPQASI